MTHKNRGASKFGTYTLPRGYEWHSQQVREALECCIWCTSYVALATVFASKSPRALNLPQQCTCNYELSLAVSYYVDGCSKEPPTVHIPPSWIFGKAPDDRLISLDYIKYFCTSTLNRCIARDRLDFWSECLSVLFTLFFQLKKNGSSSNLREHDFKQELLLPREKAFMGKLVHFSLNNSKLNFQSSSKITRDLF